jgi:hypothetical protein
MKKSKILNPAWLVSHADSNEVVCCQNILRASGETSICTSRLLTGPINEHTDCAAVFQYFIGPQVVFLIATALVSVLTLASGLVLRLPKTIEVTRDFSKAAVRR